MNDATSLDLLQRLTDLNQIGIALSRQKDITRLLDRLEKRWLISRCRHETDRRVVATRITDSGLALLSELDPVLDDAHRKQLGHMGPAKLKQLIALLEEARERPSQD